MLDGLALVHPQIASDCNSALEHLLHVKNGSVFRHEAQVFPIAGIAPGMGHVGRFDHEFAGKPAPFEFKETSGWTLTIDMNSEDVMAAK